MLTFLHGKGEAAGGEAGDALGTEAAAALLARHGPPAHASAVPGGARPSRHGSAARELARFLIVCPQLSRVRQWHEDDAPWVTAIEDIAISDHGGDAARRHLTGFSWGGAGVTRFARQPKLVRRWRSLWIVDPNPDPAVTPLPPATAPAMLHFGTYFDQDAMRQWRRDAGFAGTFATGARRVEKDLRAGHVEVADQAYGDEGAYRWLSAWEKRQGMPTA